MSTETSTQNVKLGGWTPYESVSPEELVIFDEATAGLVGVKYQPESVAVLVVAGTNYRFKCEASMPPSEVIWEAIVEIFKPLGDQKPFVVGIIRL